MAFMLVFVIFLFFLLLIGFYPYFKRNFIEGDTRKNLRFNFLWLLSSLLGFFTFYQAYEAYHVLEEYEELWTALMIFENILTGLLLIFSIVFCMLIHKHYQKNIWAKFLVVTSFQMMLFAIFNIIRLLIEYNVYDVMDFRSLFIFIGLLAAGILLRIKTTSLTSYSAEDFLNDIYE